MHIFIDESGIHRKEGFSSIVLIYVDLTAINELNKSILKIEKQLEIEPFHWAHSSWQVRTKFIDAFSQFNFNIKAAVFANPFHEKIMYPDAIKKLIVGHAIKSIVIDGKKGHSFELAFKKTLRDLGVRTQKLITANDLGFPALRIADACAGIIRFHRENPQHVINNHLYRKIKHKFLQIK